MKKEEKIFISQMIEELDKSIIIEEDENSIWAYLMNKDFKLIEFDGFLCSIQPPTDSYDKKDIQKKPPPLINEYANEFSYLPTIRGDQIRIETDIENQLVKIMISNDLYLRLDLEAKKSYSKGLSKDGPYGLTLNEK